MGSYLGTTILNFYTQCISGIRVVVEALMGVLVESRITQASFTVTDLNFFLSLSYFNEIFESSGVIL